MNPLSLKTFGVLSAIGLVASAPCFAEQSRTGVHIVTRGESVSTIASRYGLTIAEMRKLNPGVNFARLEVGANIRVVPAAPDTNFAIRPGVSVRTSGSYIPTGTPYQAPDTAQKQRLRVQLEENRRAERLAAARRADAERVAQQRREQALAQRYRKFGSCTYDWQSWGISPSGIRSVKASCPGRINEVAVDCTRLKVAEMSLRSWGGWKTPTSGSQEDFIVEVCSNVVGAPEPVYSAPNALEVPMNDTPAQQALSKTLQQRYEEAIRAQQEWLRRMQQN